MSRRAPAEQRRSETVLSARELVKVYETGGTTTRALDGVSLDVPRGRLLAIMGPSGSGKSTLLHLLGGLDSPTSGDVSLEGRSLSGLSDKEVTLGRRGRVGFVFQFFNLVPVLTVAENVALPLVIEGRKPQEYQKRLDGLLRALGITDCADKLPSQISGGQQQRTAIARALMPRPALLLADEPTGNLDTKTGHEILRLIRRASRKLGQTVVMVTHDPVAASFGDEIVHLTDGLIDGRLTPDHAKGGDDRSQAVLAWLQELGA